MGSVSVVAAFLAGLASFVSPCVLPMLPTFLLVLAGSSAGAGETRGDGDTGRRRILLGNTLAFLKSYLMAKGAKSISIVTLLDKPSRREKAVEADLSGFVVPDEFVVGYGLDYAQLYRNLPYIGVLKPAVYENT